MPGPGRKPTVSNDEILDVFRQATDPVLTTTEVAEQIELSRRGAFDRLDQLADDDVIEMKKVGETGAVWWFPRGLRERFAPNKP
jgi:response regulator of citrate/malate metabolism